MLAFVYHKCQVEKRAAAGGSQLLIKHSKVLQADYGNALPSVIKSFLPFENFRKHFCRH